MKKSKTPRLKIEINIPEEDVAGLFISACEGGSNYWLQATKPVKRRIGSYDLDMLKYGFTAQHVDPDTGRDPKKVLVTTSMIRKALAQFAEHQPRHFAALMSGDADAETGDQFMQWCVLGESIYG